MIPKGFSNLKQRLGSSGVGIALVATLLFFAHHPLLRYLFLGALCAIAALGMNEFYRFCRPKGALPSKALGIGIGLAYLVTHYFSPFGPLVLAIGLALLFISRFTQTADAIVSLSVTLFGILYIAIPLGFILDLVAIPSYGRLWVAYLIIVTKIADTGAYFGGKLLGRRLLAPKLSPKKTWEGALSGSFCACVTSWLFSLCYPQILVPWEAVALGGFLAVMGQIGDLSESVLKRDAAFKDSSTLPGLGGVLDLLDSILFTTPTLYFILQGRI